MKWFTFILILSCTITAEDSTTSWKLGWGSTPGAYPGIFDSIEAGKDYLIQTEFSGPIFALYYWIAELYSINIPGSNIVFDINACEKVLIDTIHHRHEPPLRYESNRGYQIRFTAPETLFSRVYIIAFHLIPNPHYEHISESHTYSSLIYNKGYTEPTVVRISNRLNKQVFHNCVNQYSLTGRVIANPRSFGVTIQRNRLIINLNNLRWYHAREQ